jgi:hypothetical protein
MFPALSRVSGRTLDLGKLVQTNGADAALTLLQQAKHLKATTRPRHAFWLQRLCAKQ